MASLDDVSPEVLRLLRSTPPFDSMSNEELIQSLLATRLFDSISDEESLHSDVDVASEELKPEDQDATEVPSLEDVDSEVIRALRAIPLFESLSDEEFLRLAAEATLEEVNPGDVVFQYYDEANEVLYAISSGTLRVHHAAYDKQEVAPLEINRGDFFGKHPVLSGICRGCIITAFSRVTLLRLEQTSYFRLAPRLYPEISQKLLTPYLTAFLKTIPPFSSLDKVADLCNLFEVLEFSSGEQICSRGELCAGMYILYSGEANCEYLQSDGYPATQSLYTGDTLGARTLLIGTTWNLTTKSKTATTWLVLAREGFDDLIVELPELVPDDADSLRFGWQEPGEHVIYAEKSQWIHMLGQHVAVLVLVIIASTLTKLSLRNTQLSSVSAFTAGVAIVVISIWIMRQWILWWHQFYIVTTERVVSQKALSISEVIGGIPQTSEFPLAQVQYAYPRFGSSSLSAYLAVSGLMLLVPIYGLLTAAFYVTTRWDSWLLTFIRWARRPENLMFFARVIYTFFEVIDKYRHPAKPDSASERHTDTQVALCSVTMAENLRKLTLILWNVRLFQSLNQVLKKAIAQIQLADTEAVDLIVGRTEEFSEERPRIVTQLVFRRIRLAMNTNSLIEYHASRARQRDRKRRQLDVLNQLRPTLGLAQDSTESIPETSRSSTRSVRATWKQHPFALVPTVIRRAGFTLGLVAYLWVANQNTWFPFNFLGIRMSLWLFPILLVLAMLGKMSIFLVIQVVLVYLAVAGFARSFPFNTPTFQTPPESIALICLLAAVWIFLRASSYVGQRARNTDRLLRRREYHLEDGHLTAEDSEGQHSSRQSTSRVALKDVESVRAARSGLFGRILDFGDVWVLTTKGQFVLRKVSNPLSVEQVVRGAVVRWWQQKRQRELQPISEIIREWLLAYAAATKSESNDLFLGRERVLTDDPTVRAYLRVLVVTAQPVNKPLLQYWSEWNTILQALQQVKGHLYVSHVMHATIERIERELERGYQVVHFIGHGTTEPRTRRQGLILEDDVGRAVAYSGEQIAELLSMQKVRLTVLNVCDSDKLAKELLQDKSLIEAAVGMRGSIPDPVGIEFAKWFYSGLASGKPISVAFDQAKRSLSKHSPSEDAAFPVLETRERKKGEKGIFFVPLQGEARPRIKSGAPRYSNIGHVLPEPSDYYCDRSLIEIARMLQQHQNSIAVLSGSKLEHRLKVARAAAERNSWRFEGGIVCVQRDSKESTTGALQRAILKVLELNLAEPDRGTILLTLRELAEQGSPVFLVLAEVDPAEIVPDSDLIQFLGAAVEPLRNKALITCSQSLEVSRQLNGLIEIPLVSKTVPSRAIVTQQ